MGRQRTATGRPEDTISGASSCRPASTDTVDREWSVCAFSDSRNARHALPRSPRSTRSVQRTLWLSDSVVLSVERWHVERVRVKDSLVHGGILSLSLSLLLLLFSPTLPSTFYRLLLSLALLLSSLYRGCCATPHAAQLRGRGPRGRRVVPSSGSPRCETPFALALCIVVPRATQRGCV